MRHARAMTRRSQVEIPADLRARLETSRLDLLALFRALDRLGLALAEIPQRLIRQLFELDADCAEALWALDQPPGTLGHQPHAAGHAGRSGTVTGGHGQTQEEPSQTRPSYPGPI